MCRLKFWRGLELLRASVGPHPSPSKGSFKKRKIKAYKTSVSFFWSLTMAQAILVPSTAGVIRVLAADRSPMNSQLLTEALTRNRHFALSSAVSASDVLSIMASERPHVAVLSAHLDGNPNGGAELGRRMRVLYPETRVVMLLDSSERNLVVEAFRSGACGVFCRTQSLMSLAKCIQSVHIGQIWANSTELHFLIEALAEFAPVRMVNASGTVVLSKREHDVVACVVRGLTNREIAQALKLTEHTVKNYLFRIFDKLGVSSRVELALYALSLARQRNEGEPSSFAPHLAKSVSRMKAPGRELVTVKPIHTQVSEKMVKR